MSQELCQGPQPIANGTRAILHGIAVTHLRSSDGATAIVADHGAHLLSWCPASGVEALYLSPTSRFGAVDAIRGGVPVIFPQFGEQGPGKRHGIARVLPWRLLSVTIKDGAAVAWLALQGRLDLPDNQESHDSQDSQDSQESQESQESQRAGAAAYRLLLEMRLQGESLQLGLTIDNIGSAAWSCQAALHTYLRVDALVQCGVDGLQECRFIDQTAGSVVATQAPARLDFFAEVDRIYTDAPSPLLLCDGQRRLGVAQHGFTDTVLWNPGAIKAAALTDLPAQGYQKFICIEAAVIATPLTLEPGTCWRASQRLTMLPGRAQADCSPANR